MLARSRGRMAGCLVAGLLVLGMVSPGAAAAPATRTLAPAAPTFTVNSFEDDVAAAPLDNGICEFLSGTGICTLRAAIMKANHYPGGGVTILLPSGTYSLTIPPDILDGEAVGDLNITNTVTIIGAGAATTFIDGNQLDRVFNIGPAARVTISGVTVRGGNAPETGGGLQNDGTLTLADDVFSGNRTRNGSAGAGLINDKTLALIHSVVENNVADGNGAGVFNDNSSTMQITDSIIRDNQALNGSYGGGVSNSGALTLMNSLVQGNQADGRGGGLVNFQGTASVVNSTISDNSALCDGGGIYTNAPITATFSTIVGNLANSQLIGATPTCPDGGLGGGISNVFGAVNLRASLVGQNYAGANPDDGNGIIHSHDYNLIQTTAGMTLTGVTANNRTGLDPLIDSPRSNGGPTPTRALLAGSPALDVVPLSQCNDELGAPLTTDQRGFSRPVNGLCDIGAYEGQQPTMGYLRNLVRNGDAEGAAGSPAGGFVGVPSWHTAGQLMTVVPYNTPGGFPSVPTDTVPAQHGDNFFAGGVSAVAVGTQAIDVSPLAADIDTGNVSYDFSADLGGFDSQDDNAQVEADFLDQASHLLMLTTIGPVTAADRGNQTGLLHRDDSAAVPTGTRTVELFVTLTNTGGPGSYNDGYADNISFVLLPKASLFVPLTVRP